MSHVPLWLRSTIAAMLLPGIVAGVIPQLLLRGAWRWPVALGALRWIGALVLAIGLVVLLLTIWDFARKGEGTLAPWDAPRQLVHARLYGWTRNPMYLGVLGCIFGLGLLAASGGVLLYGVFMTVVFHVRVIVYEEPVLRRQFGDAYARYLESVPRWIPRRPVD
jgi:protein-S-isoprenylcysteine O-methyltransferase Ste14